VAAFDFVRTKQRRTQANLWLGPEEIAQHILDLAAQKRKYHLLAPFAAAAGLAA
jgi:hypothetical protein